MLCPNCRKDFESGTVCPSCKVDTVLFSGTVRISDFFYNKGLSQSKAGDLSGAVESLTKSVQVNKNNVQARNLLGLVLFEVGRIGDALKEWVVSQSLLRENNPAAGYLQEAHNSGRSLEHANDAVRMYNQALEYIRLKSDDMAIIQLKKAVECSPKFIDALNLLALCYLIQRDKEKASALVERVLAIDVNNTVALNYYKELYPDRSRPDARPRKTAATVQQSTTTNYSYQRLPMREKKRTNFHIAEILSFIIGAACMFAAVYVLVIPALTREKDLEIESYRTLMESVRSDLTAQVDLKTADINENEKTISQLETDMEDLEGRYDVLERTNLVLFAYGLIADAKFQEAVDTIAGIDITRLPADIVQKAKDVNTIAYPQLAQLYFDEGRSAYDDDDFIKATVEFEKTRKYANEETPFRNDLLYYLGMLYVQDESKVGQGLQYLQDLVAEYPQYNRTRRNEANRIISDLTSEE
ncbi:MAG: tetratricopeptide repeat protein [Clostridiales bacterium]|jgi:tetratricopeptide (TPR) repeat protein|nr:tetratricopeptide repeat protein [Clostridiales bacterium]